ncbi:MAG: sensor domain-containing diguanylate cyclase [Arhodomonas sp.]|nr:sensor domain-containing diguanylate cyclase [Arhodomonas sp.]
MVVSTVRPLYEDGAKIGVISTDIQFKGLRTILENIELPTGSSVLLVDDSGRPFIGTDESYVGRKQLPPSNDEFFVASSAPMSNGWRASVIVPRAALAKSFADLLQPIMISSALILLLGGGLTSLLVGRFGSRAYRLANYFQDTVDRSAPLREIFRTHDEFSFLNKRFNQVTNEARVGEERKLEQERSFRFLIEQAPVGFFETTTTGRLLYINPHCASLLGYSQSEAMREIASVRDLYQDGSDRDLFLQDLQAHGEVRNRKIRFVKRSGETFWISMTAHIREDNASGDTADVIEGFLIDVTGDVEERETLARMAESDPLTGAANRRAFDTVAEAVAKRAHATGQRVALLLFDIDQFKAINDTYGHDVGDALLQQIANLGKHNLRENDLFARIGGDEFAGAVARSQPRGGGPARPASAGRCAGDAPAGALDRTPDPEHRHRRSGRARGADIGAPQGSR